MPRVDNTAGQESTLSTGTPSGSAYNSQVPAQASTDRLAYVKAVLAKGGWPDTASNEQFLLNIAQREHNVADVTHAQAAFNLFNTERPMPGSTFFNYTSPGHGVQEYASFDDGVAAAVATLKTNYYKNIQAGLSAGNAAEADAAGKFSQDLSSWSGGAYSTVSDQNGANAPLVAGRGVTDTAGLGAPGVPNVSGGVDGFLQSQAPELAKALGDPQVSALLKLWGTGTSMDDQQFKNALEQTTWWKTTPQAARLLLIARATDPATAKQNLDNTTNGITAIAARAGVTLTSAQASTLAAQSMAGSWSSDQINQAISKMFNYTGQALTGDAAANLAELQRLYSTYHVPSTPQTLNAQLQQLMAGSTTLPALTGQLVDQAKLAYGNNPALAAYLSPQHSVDDWASPLVGQVARTLGADPNSVDLSDQKWSWLLQPSTDANGQPTGQSMTLDDVTKRVQTDPVFGYSKTSNGIASYQNMATKLTQAFTGGAGVG